MKIVKASTARSTGSRVLVIDNRDRDFMDDKQRWYTLCDDHGFLVGHETRSIAISWSAEPQTWCEGCASKIKEKE